jgi:hypothetical protein
MIKPASVAVFGVITGILVGCSRTDTPTAPSPSPAERTETAAAEPQALTGEATIDACQLLTDEEIAGVQGEAPARRQLVGQAEGGLAVSQCNFLLPSGSNSMAIRVVQRGKGPDALDPKEVWKETFHRPPPADPAAARYTRKYEKVAGVGDEAFWLGNAKSGGLHVLTGDRYIRVNVGGQEEIPAKIEKTSKLSQIVLPRLAAQQ